MTRAKTADARLAGCHGFSVVVAEGRVGSVETPLFPETGGDPDYLLVRTTDVIRGAFRVVPATLIRRVEPIYRTVVLAADLDAVAALPEHLPLDGRRSRL